MFAESIANYVETHRHYADLSKREAVIEALMLVTSGDMAAAQGCLDAMGVKLDLYEYGDLDGPLVVLHPGQHVVEWRVPEVGEQITYNGKENLYSKLVAVPDDTPDWVVVTSNPQERTP